VEFDYRTRDGSMSRRHLEPWGLVAWHGRWYAVGHDRDRDDVRVFRLSRITSDVTAVGRPGAVEVPPEVDLRSIVHTFDDPTPSGVAQVRVAEGTGGGLRRQALGEPTPDPTHEGWVILDLPYRDVGSLVDDVVGYGPTAVVVSPPEARRAAIERLRGAVVSAELQP
jgi:proteasome accessory factor B